MAEHVLRWLGDREAYEQVCGELKELCARVSEPGACDRAAAAVLELVEGRGERMPPETAGVPGAEMMQGPHGGD